MTTSREILLLLIMRFRAWHFLLSHCIHGGVAFSWLFWCKQLVHCSDKKKAFRLWKETCIEYTGKVKITGQFWTWQWLKLCDCFCTFKRGEQVPYSLTLSTAFLVWRSCAWGTQYWNKWVLGGENAKTESP